MVLEREDEAEDDSRRIDCPVLVTERLVLRRPHVDDIDEMADLADNRRVAEMLGTMPHPYGRRDAEAFVRAQTEAGRKDCSYALALAENGAFIGCASLKPSKGRLVLGYWIGEPYWGRGYATEAAHALVDLAFRATTVETLHVNCRVINAASRRVIHKCGFQYAGQGMIESLSAGRVPVELYTLDRKTWVSLRSWGMA